MKTLKLLLLAGIAMICTFCQPDEGDRYTGPLNYSFSMSFQDAEGNDLIKGIKGTEPEGSIEADYVDPEEYSLVSSPDRYELGFYSNPHARYDNPYRYPRMGLSSPDAYAVWDEDAVRADYRSAKLIYDWIAKEYNEDEWVQREYNSWKASHDAMDGRYHLWISMSSSQKNDLKTITYTLTCPHVFGDDKEYEIVTYWKKPSNWDKKNNGYRVCYLVEVDGKKFSDISYIASGQVAFATITIDRP